MFFLNIYLNIDGEDNIVCSSVGILLMNSAEEFILFKEIDLRFIMILSIIKKSRIVILKIVIDEPRDEIEFHEDIESG